MTKFKLEINVPGFNEARNDPAILSDLMSRGRRIASAAGGEPDFEVIESSTASRARVVVVTATPKAMRAEATDRALTRAFEAGRG